MVGSEFTERGHVITFLAAVIYPDGTHKFLHYLFIYIAVTAVERPLYGLFYKVFFLVQ